MSTLATRPYRRRWLGRVWDRIVLWWQTQFFVIVKIGFFLGFVGKERMSHNNGIGAKGKFIVDLDPLLPFHPYFEKDKEYPCQIRHAAATFYDDAMAAIRSISIKTSDKNWKESLDLELNTGSIGLFWNAVSFFKLAALRDEKYGVEYAKYYKKYPVGKEGARQTLRRNPSSFTNLVYYSKTPLFYNSEGRTRYVKYRVIPFEPVEETGTIAKFSPQWVEPENQRIDPIVNPNTQQALINYQDEEGFSNYHNVDELPNPRSRNYLKEEYKHRVKKGVYERNPVKYVLQAQVREKEEGEDLEIFNCCVDWPQKEFPWLRVGIIEIYKTLDWAESNKLTFSFNNLPKGLGTIPAYSIYDYNSLNYLRKKADWAKKARLIAYKLKGVPDEIPNDNNRNSFTIHDPDRPR